MQYEKLRRQGSFFGRFLDTVGDGTGNANANVDGSVTPQEFRVTVPIGYLLMIDELLVSVRDNGLFVASGYGGLPTLTNGIQMLYSAHAGAALVDRTPQRPVVCNGCWALYATDYQIRLSTASDTLHTTRHDFRTPLIIGQGGEYVARIRDDMTGLTQHYFRVHGMLIKL